MGNSYRRTVRTESYAIRNTRWQCRWVGILSTKTGNTPRIRGNKWRGITNNCNSRTVRTERNISAQSSWKRCRVGVFSTKTWTTPRIGGDKWRTKMPNSYCRPVRAKRHRTTAVGRQCSWVGVNTSKPIHTPWVNPDKWRWITSHGQRLGCSCCQSRCIWTKHQYPLDGVILTSIATKPVRTINCCKDELICTVGGAG